MRTCISIFEASPTPKSLNSGATNAFHAELAVLQWVHYLRGVDRSLYGNSSKFLRWKLGLNFDI